MPIDKIFREMPPQLFFGLKNQQAFDKFGMEHLIELKEKVQNKINFVELGLVNVDNISSLRQFVPFRTKNLSDFREKQLATLTLKGPEFKHSSDSNSMNTHTIGFVINKNPNEYFYKSPEQIIIMDSLGDSYVGAKKVHQALIDSFLRPEFPQAEIIITKTPQQTDDSVSCLNWTLANLEVAKANIGRVDIPNLLPKSSDFDSILERQKLLLHSYY